MANVPKTEKHTASMLKEENKLTDLTICIKKGKKSFMIIK